MKLHFFFIPAREPALASAELNALLASARVLGMQREWLAHAGARHVA